MTKETKKTLKVTLQNCSRRKIYSGVNTGKTKQTNIEAEEMRLLESISKDH